MLLIVLALFIGAVFNGWWFYRTYEVIKQTEHALNNIRKMISLRDGDVTITFADGTVWRNRSTWDKVEGGIGGL